MDYIHASGISKMKTLAFWILCLAPLIGLSQNTIGLPEIMNYSKQAYAAGNQNWDIKQDPNGRLFFGNNEGLLSFDGTFWNLYPLPNHTIVRAIEIGKDGRIYTGGQNELGFFVPNKEGKLQYHSLLHLIPEKDRSFDDVWNICRLGDAVFFRSNKRIFQYSDNAISVYPTATEWRFMGVSNRQLVAQDLQKGLLLFQAGTWAPFLQNSALPSAALMTSFIPFGRDSSLITTLKDGIFHCYQGQLTRISSPDLHKISPQNIYKAITVDENHVALATSFDGCHIIDAKGRLIQSLTREEGLQTNNIRSLFLDRHNNLWLGLDNGIDFIAYNNAIKHIYPDKLNIGSGYSSLLFNSQLYLGTSNGLYRVPLEGTANLIYTRKNLEPVQNTLGQVWNLSTVNQTLLMGHHDGAFLIRDNKATLLDNSIGFWTFLPVSSILPSPKMVAGNYLGLRFYDFAENRFRYSGVDANFESARFVVVENENTFWVAHPYKGLYRIRLENGQTASVVLYNKKKGLLSANNNYIYKVKNRMVAATENGVYEYNETKDRFEPSAFLQGIFKNISIRYLKEDPSGNLWFIHGKELGVADLSADKPKLIYFPELTNKLVSGFENIYPLNEQNIFIGSEKGFYHVDFQAYKRNTFNLYTQVRQVRAMGPKDTVLFGGYGTPSSASVAYRYNSLHFEYNATLYGQQPNILYSYRLKGFDKGWSEWSAKTEKDYTNLPAGNYTFEVKARNNLGNESPVYNYTFSIQPPWYQTTIAYTLYSLLFLILVYGLYRWQQKKFSQQQKRYEEEQAQLRYLHQLELEKNEKELVKLRNEKLEAELASSSMHLVQKGELLSKIKDELIKLNKEPSRHKAPDEFKRIIKILGEEDKMDADWEQFAQHFDKVHSNFLSLLKKKHPNLTTNESKLCAYLRMNLSTKEIAQLMNISVRGVEISRYRLRKKLQLQTSVNLFDFLITIDGGGKEEINNEPAKRY